VSLYQRRADGDPDAFVGELARSLENLADRMVDADTRTDALAAFPVDLPAGDAALPASAYLHASRAGWRVSHDDLAGALDDLIIAARAVDAAPACAAATRARRHVRATAFMVSAQAREPDPRWATLPAWARLPIADDTLAAVNAWAAAASWNDRETAVTRFAVLSERRTEIDVLAALHPENPTLRELGTILDEISADGSSAVFARHRAGAAFAGLLNGWLTTPTWTESRDYLTLHPELPTDPRTRAVLEASAADDEEIARHLAILNLLARGGLADVYDIVIDPAVAADEATAAATLGDLARLTDIWNAAPALVGTPFVGAFLASIRALLTGDADQTAELAAAAASQASHAQRAAAAARLRRLRRARPDATITIDDLIRIYQSPDHATTTDASAPDGHQARTPTP
jgi:hypothetical protein